MLIVDFFIQSLLAGVFFIGIFGVGMLILFQLRFLAANTYLQIGISFFLSLCLYTTIISGSLFVLPEKRIALVLITILYSLISFIYLGLQRKRIQSFFQKKRKEYFFPLLACIAVVFLFFLQVYKTALLDEWLHRPIVNTFVETGAFPLVNPLSPNAHYLDTYHYGTQLGAAGIALLFQQEVPVALDIYKISVVLGTLFLLFGWLLSWSKNRAGPAVLGTIAAFFSASSFFLIDGFTASHLYNFKFIDLQNASSRPMNYPLSYSLAGLTWVNIPLTVAWALFLEQYFFSQKTQKRFLFFFLLPLLLAGFFLISEFFAVIIIFCTGLLFCIQAIQNRKISWKIAGASALALFCMLFLVANLGGPMGKLLRQGAQVPQLQISFHSEVKESAPVVTADASEGAVAEVAPAVFSIRPFTNWGYPGEKKPYIIWERPFFYLRSIGFEIFILAFLFISATRRKLFLKNHPLILLIIAFGLIIPFISSTAFGDLNLAKATEAGLMFLRIFLILCLLSMPMNFLLRWILIVFMALGTLSPLLMGTNIQWQLFSSKGKSQLCSQNPECYKGELTELLKEFQEKTGGKKNILTASAMNDKQKVVDITSSRTYEYDPNLQEDEFRDNKLEYILDTPALRKEIGTNVQIENYPILLEKGKNSIRSIQ